MAKHTKLKILFILILALIAAALSLHSGAINTTWGEIIDYCLGKPLLPQHQFLFDNLRTPRTMAAFIIGASLGTCGLVLQTLLKNPLAEPYTLGLSGGSSLGAVIALTLALEPSPFWIPFLSAAGCLLAAALVLGFGRRQLEFESRSLILFGIMLSLFFGAMSVTGLSLLSPQKLQTALLWLLGEFGTSRDLWIYKMGIYLILGIVIVALRSKSLDAMGMGEAGALSLGYSPSRERFILILVCSIMTALSVSISGLVGFIGLVSPHIARQFLKTSKHSTLILATSLIGALILTTSDLLGRTVAGNNEIPAGSIAALLGAPVLIFLLMVKKNAPVE